MRVERVILVRPRGFCAGVERALAILEVLLERVPEPIYVFHEIVHNSVLIEGFKRRGVQFVNDLKEVPEGAVCVFSAHGVSPEIERMAKARNLRVFDATCPLVTKVHEEARLFAIRGLRVVLIGHKGHEEVEGTMGHAPMFLVSTAKDVQALPISPDERVAYLTQTTLSLGDTAKVVEALKARFPNLMGPKKEDICYATYNRQMAVQALARVTDVVFVVGSKNSSNSQRLGEVARAEGVPAYVVDGAEHIEPWMFERAKAIGVTAGASAPETLVSGIVKHFEDLGAERIEELGVAEESMTFRLPKMPA
ncbi:MAG: 4-hydroxy-3-methylbut-2-enyl diphosphate reductase [Nitrospirota bacterium]|jgi:4-hydroxy-3-methylbut-2-enyl diphosphate reductase|nr:4-hydroxy-3-methylbut-2-enyl diphosphate reductase [Nitrospirota bacterium]